jgi:hypothetical protein
MSLFGLWSWGRGVCTYPNLKWPEKTVRTNNTIAFLAMIYSLVIKIFLAIEFSLQRETIHVIKNLLRLYDKISHAYNTFDDKVS